MNDIILCPINPLSSALKVMNNRTNSISSDTEDGCFLLLLLPLFLLLSPLFPSPPPLFLPAPATRLNLKDLSLIWLPRIMNISCSGSYLQSELKSL